MRCIQECRHYFQKAPNSVYSDGISLPYIDITSMEWTVLYFKGSRVKISINDVFLSLSLKIVFILANSANLDKMLHFIWVFGVCQST